VKRSLIQLERSLRRLDSGREDRGRGRILRGQYYSGLQTQSATGTYRWDGRRRRSNPNRPFLVFQYTLSGCGRFEIPGNAWELLPGSAFLAIVPGDHHYYLPADSTHWTFFFLLIRHPYVIERIRTRQMNSDPAFELPASEELIRLSHDLFADDCRHGFADPWVEELKLLEWMLAFERFAGRSAEPQEAGRELLAHVRSFLRRSPLQSIGVDQLAADLGMSRSNYSHRFKKETGQSPAAYLTALRLESVCQRLRFSKDKLDVIAHDCGFADANHLCKVFRRHLHTTPASFRRQLGQ